MHREIFGAAFETNNGSFYLLDVNTGNFIYLEPQFRDALDVRVQENGLQQIAVKPNLPAEIEQQMQEAFQSKMISSAKPEKVPVAPALVLVNQQAYQMLGMALSPTARITATNFSTPSFRFF